MRLEKVVRSILLLKEIGRNPTEKLLEESKIKEDEKS